MRWRCALLQRWLPEYPDGDLPAFWKRRLRTHLDGCPSCRQELAELGEVLEAVKAAPVADPGPDFWEDFSREMHLKLVQVAHPAPAPWRLKRPYYLLGAPAVAVLLLWLGAHLMEHQTPLPGPAPQMAQQPGSKTRAQEQVSPASLPVPSLAKKKSLEQLRSMAKEIDEDGELLDEDFTSWDPEPVLSELTDQEREILFQRLRSKEKDGSCVTFSSSVSWA
jgi:anti-sigma factor RsiW